MEPQRSNRLFTEVLGAQPNAYDVAIVSINSSGTIGQLNQLVIDLLGYHKSILNKLDLKEGFQLYREENKTPILFIVTVGIGSTEDNLRSNLYHGIGVHFEFLAHKKVWIPLMGTGAGKLSLDKSYEIITTLLTRFSELILKENIQFTISIPNNDDGKKFYNQINQIELTSNSNSFNIENSTEKIEQTPINNNPKEVSSLINYLNANYYFVGINWEGNIQTERFYLARNWETGYVERFSGIIKNILVDDILIIKEPLKIDGVDYVKIIAIGRVVENPLNGKTVGVNWIIKNLNITIKALGYNDSTITTAHLDSVREIFSKISKKELSELKSSLPLRKSNQQEDFEVSDTVEIETNVTESIIENEQTTESLELVTTNTTTLAGLISDTDSGTDYLNISKDVNAFARVMAAKSFEPPLAIALLGKWGSGKSFFMRKLKEGIQNLSTFNPANGFCTGIAHVHFNAWSYMDANLWASIVTRIFEGLQEYITGDSKAKNLKKEIEEKLTKNLNIAKEEIDSLQKQSDNINAQIKTLTSEKEIAEKELNDKISAIERTTLISIIAQVDQSFNVTAQINDALNNNVTFIDTQNQLERIVPKEYWINPTELYNQLKSKYAFIKTFFYGENWWKNCIWLGVFCIIAFLVPRSAYLASLLLSWHDFTLSPKTWVLVTTAGTALVRGIDTYKKLKTLIAPFWKIKVDYEQQKENALFEFHQKEKALLLEIENSKSKINSINEQINKATVIKASIEFKLENALSTEALYSFIERRANSEDYKKHLGIVSIIRKDFEVLNDLLVDHGIETTKNKESADFKAMFDKPLERIILYIDDLDRCPEERVVEVLEAVNLLMAFPLFIVVVGVDPRWVKNALIKKHKLQFTGKSDSGLECIEPSSYLEKIFQVPFHLKDANNDSIKNMIKTLALSKPTIVETVTTIDPETENGPIIPLPDLNADGTIRTEEAIQIEPDIELQIQDNVKQQNPTLINKEAIAALEISESESELLQSMSEILGNNPRAIKRFVNIYRIVKTHEDFNINEDDSEAKLNAMMFILALSIGKFRDRLVDFEHLVSIPSYSSYTLINVDVNLRSIVDIVKNNKNIMKIKFKDFNQNYQFIKRFTFKNI